MVFSSATFLFYFLPLVLALHFLACPGLGLRNMLLLAASFFFYAYGEGGYILVMILSILANYCFGLWISSRCETNSRIPIGVSIAFNIALLVAFKYTNFIVDNLNPLIAGLGLAPISIGKVHLPIGVSFFTFHCMSYLMDIYRRQTPPQRSLPVLALYISLFPQLVAGPIIRYKDIAEQLTRRSVSLARFARGVSRFVAGLGKKVLIANTLALPADKIFSLPPEQLTTQGAWLGVLCYTLQIYFDFSGYSDMAIGLADMFGFKFMENFNYPYISKSIREFWRRWHISLSTWFRDYLYIPLGGNRCSPLRVHFNLVLVFFLCGLWHGASWNFVIWGVYHGLFLVLERTSFGRFMDRHALLGHAYTLLVVMLGWVFFRADSLPVALTFLKTMAGFAVPPTGEFAFVTLYSPKLGLALAAAVLGSLPLIPYLAKLKDAAQDKGSRLALVLADATDLALGLVLLPGIFLLCLMSLASGTHNPFIYFQF